MLVFIVRMFFVSISLLCFGLFVLCGFRVRRGGVIALVASKGALCRVLLLIGWEVVGMVGCSDGVRVSDSFGDVDCVDLALTTHQSTTYTSSTPYSPPFASVVTIPISSPPISYL